MIDNTLFFEEPKQKHQEEPKPKPKSKQEPKKTEMDPKTVEEKPSETP